MRRRLVVLFAVAVTAFVAFDLVLILSLWPQLRRSEALSSQYAASTRIIARMRGDLHAIRSAATQQHVAARSGGGGADLAELGRAREDLKAAALDYAATEMHDEEREAWRTLEETAFPAFAAAVAEVLRDAAGERDQRQRDLAELGRATTVADGLLQRMAEINAQELEARGREIHATLFGLVVLCGALGAIGILGGVLLMRWALQAVHAYERSTEERLRELDDFAGRVAHDLRNPLQAIGMALSLIRRRTDDERTLATCSRAEESATRMAGFIQELLMFARSGAKPAPGACAPVEQVLREVQQDLAPLAEQRKVVVRILSPPGVHAAITPAALRAIVGNLADNAVKHVPAEGARSRVVELAVEERPREVHIAVRDGGAGIPAEVLPRLFDPFFRATDRPGGFGLGLKTVKRLVDAHRGSLAVESEEGRGSVFTVTLPAAPPPPRPAAGEPAAAAPR